MSDIFYRTNELTLKERKSLLKFAKENSIRWWVDEVDCNKSFERHNIKIPFDEVIKELKMASYLVIANRHNSYGEIAFCSFDEPDHFVWINVSLDTLHDITKKFKLQKR